MTSSYRGIYTLGPRHAPTDVQVCDTGGIELSLPLEIYLDRGVKPDWSDLPSQKHYQVLINILKAEKGPSVYINQKDAEECLNKGWLESLGVGGYILTIKGRNLLE